MAEYTYKNIIIDPTSKEAKNCIGKMVYFANNPNDCLCYANNNSDYFCGILQSIEVDKSLPFVIRTDDNIFYTRGLASIIILKEEPKSEYVPFDTIEEFVKASLEHNKNHYLAGTGIWLKKLYDNNTLVHIFMVSSFCEYDNTIFVDDDWLDLKEVLDLYTFLDGSSCGK